MSLTIAPPLARFAVFRTANVDVAREEVARIFCPHLLVPHGPAPSFDACHHSVDLGGFTLNYVRYGADVTIEPGQLGSFYLLQMPLTGAASIACGADVVDASPRRASLLSPTRHVTMRWSGDCGKLLIQIPRAAMEMTLRSQLGRSLRAPLEFDPSLPLDDERGRRIAGLVDLLRADAEADDALFTRGGGGAEMREVLITALLRALRHNYSDALRAPQTGIAPRHVRRAEEFLHAHAASPLTLADIAAHAGVSVRALQEGFRRFRDTTPLEALRDLRLEGARASLAAAGPNDGVTDIALRWGFTHLGRFAVSYRGRFNERPSETLRRRTG